MDVAVQAKHRVSESLEVSKNFLISFFPKNSTKLRDPTPAQTPLTQRNGSAGGGQAAGQLGTGTPGAGSMGPSPHMMRRGKSLHMNPVKKQPKKLVGFG